MKPKISLLDNQFSHTHPGSFGCGDLKIPPTSFEWDRQGVFRNDLVVMTENSFWTIDSVKCKTKVALLLEPVCISPDPYNWISQPENYRKFEYVLTHNKELLTIDQRFRWYPFGGSWVLPSEQQIYPKTKNISIIASWKNQTEGHKLRHEVVKRFGDRIDVFGNGYQKIGSVLEALKDYKYTIVIENERREGFFTEKLISSIRAGCIPFYWGAPDIGEYLLCDKSTLILPDDFHKGFHTFDYIGQLDILMDLFECDVAEYTDSCVKENFEKAAQYCIPEDWLWLNFFKPLNLI